MLKISGHQREAVADVERRGDDARIVAEGRAQHLPQIALLGLGGHAGGRAGALAVDDHDGNLRLRREAEALGHQRKAAAGGRAHGANAGVRRANRHVDDADLVLDLAHHDVRLARVRRHPVQHAGRGAHGIGAVELDARRRASHGHGGVAAEHGVAGLGHRQRPREGLEVLRGVVVAGAREVDVLVDDRLVLLAELLGEHALRAREIRRPSC